MPAQASPRSSSAVAALIRLFLPPPDYVVGIMLSHMRGFNEGLCKARDIYDPEPFEWWTERHAGAVASRSVFH